ncbi:MAG: tyrosine-type recombinase/integrase, partial [Leptospiraceae bacterium]|nr:tyrosine-type recombinase/integrase [Leptospiraceae bacterium]
MKDNEQTTYSEMEFNAIMENCRDNFQHSLCLKILCNFGLTISEAINIKNKDIDLEKKEIKIYPWK